MEKNFGSIVFYIRRPVDRRRVKNGRLFLEQEDLDHDPVRRGNMIGRRMIGDRRRLLLEILDSFGEEVL
jgi:hypothetical protein